MRALDRRQLLHHPVSAEDVPDYYEVIPHPMDFSTLESKIPDYEDFSQFVHDASLIFTNCMTYNKPNTPYFRLARRIQQ
ncbi:Bromodomain-containing protein, partial [Piptocephalis cylindrospora]